MAVQGGAPGGQDRADAADRGLHGPADGRRAAGPPPRPPMSDRTPAPLTRAEPPPVALRLSRTLWVLSILAGLVTAGFAVLGRDGRAGRIADQVRELDPDRAAETASAVAQLVLWGTVVAVVVVVLAEALLVRRLTRRRGGARAGLFLVLLLHAAVAVVADAFLAGEDVGDRVLLAVWVLLAVLGLLVGLAPSVGRWLRGR